MEKYFLIQIQHKAEADTWTKGAVVHDSLDAARQGYHAYLGAYGYGHDPDIDFVSCMVTDMTGRVCNSTVDNRIPAPEPALDEEA